MAIVPGAFTTDGIPLQQLYTEMMDSVEMHNETMRDFMGLFCGSPTQKRMEQIRTRSMQFQRAGSDTTRPNMQHVDRWEIDLKTPERMVLNASITAEAWEKGMSSDEVQTHHNEAMAADKRLIVNAVLEEALTGGCWYNGTVTPPRYKNNTFLSSHDHYLAFDLDGTPNMAALVEAKHEVAHHGYDKGIVLFLNSEQIANIEKLTEFDGSDAALVSPMMQKLQEFGYTVNFQASGIPIIEEDWVPAGYGLAVALSEKPLRWRITDNAVTANVIVATHPMQGDIAYHWIEEYARWISCTGVMPGAGVALYFGGSTWVDAPISIAA